MAHAARVPRRLTRHRRSVSSTGEHHETSKRICSRWRVAAALFGAGAAQAQVSDDVIKIGVLTDMSSLYADLAGPGSVRRGAAWRSRTSAPRSKGMKVEVISADHQNKPDVGSQHRAPVVRHRQGRRDRRRAELRRRAGGEPDHAREEARRSSISGAGIVRPDRQGLLAEHRALDLRHLDAGQRHRQRDRQDRRRQLVLPDRRLRVRPRARARHRGGGREGNGGKVLGKVRASAQHAGLLVVPAAGAGVARPRSSAWPTPAATPSTRSSRRPSSASSRAGRTSPACWCSSPTCTRSGLKTAQGLILTETFYWDLNDQTRAFAKRFAAQDKRQPSDDGPGRRLLGACCTT